MSYRERLPQLSGGVFITDGGMETTLIFQDEFDLPCFASFPLLDRADGRLALRAYFQPYIAIAREQRVGIILDAVTWRASRDWGSRLGYSPEALDAANREAVRFLEDIRGEHVDAGIDIVLCGCIGPRGDAYRASESMTAAEAESYHAPQLGTLSETAADMVSALTMTNAGEAVGIVRAAAQARAAGRRLLHRRDRRPPAERPVTAQCDRAGRRRDRTEPPPTSWSTAPTRPMS